MLTNTENPTETEVKKPRLKHTGGDYKQDTGKTHEESTKDVKITENTRREFSLFSFTIKHELTHNGNYRQDVTTDTQESAHRDQVNSCNFAHCHYRMTLISVLVF